MTGNPNDDESTPEDAADSDDVELSDYKLSDEPQAEIATDGWNLVEQAHYDREGDRELATALVTAIADAKDVDPLDSAAMPPLYESLDVAALEATFFGPSGAGPDHQEDGLVTFHYTGYKVALRDDGWIFVYEPR
jgi:hypothetical protein